MRQFWVAQKTLFMSDDEIHGHNFDLPLFKATYISSQGGPFNILQKQLSVAK